MATIRPLEAGDYDKGEWMQLILGACQPPGVRRCACSLAMLGMAPRSLAGFLQLLAQLTTVGEVSKAAFEGERKGRSLL